MKSFLNSIPSFHKNSDSKDNTPELKTSPTKEAMLLKVNPRKSITHSEMLRLLKSQSADEHQTLEEILRETAEEFHNVLPQSAPGASAAVGHNIENSIPLSIFPIQPDKFCICFCGLPGRGKTHIAKRLARYLSFFHATPTKVFSVADYRRQTYGELKTADWFATSNKEAIALRDACYAHAINDMASFLEENSSGVVIMDSTTATHQRRVNLFEAMQRARTKVLFIEVRNNNQDFLTEQYRRMARDCPDYAGLDKADAELDYARRVEAYASMFEPLDDEHPVESGWSFFKCDHSRDHYVVHKVYGYLPLKITNFIMNMRTSQHSFYLSRHGQSEYNKLGRIGGDSGLSEHGLEYAHKLADYVEENITRDESGNRVPARLWTSSMRRTKETAQFIKTYKIIKRYDGTSTEYEWEQMKPRAWHHLDELFAGDCDGMTYEEIEGNFPDEWTRRSVDKLAYRYPRGESYLDVIARLEPMIVEMERHKEPVLIIAHQGILRIIYAFYKGLTRREAPYVSIPLNTVVKLTPMPYDCTEERHLLIKADLSADGQNEPPSH